jgi:hypothetical protein
MSTTRHLPELHEVAVVRDFISADEHRSLLDWAGEQFSEGHLIPNSFGKHRFFKRYEIGDPEVPDLFWDVRRRAVSMFSVSDYEDEPGFKCFLGCNTEGGTVQRHTDPSPPDKHHVRMNIMLSKPISGGCPIIDGTAIDVAERDLWCFFPTAMPHESTPVVGKRRRFVVSIGILVPKTVAA